MGWIARVAVAGVTVPVLALGLVGCTPGVRGVVGLERTEDGWRVAYATCAGFHLSAPVALHDRSQVNDQHEYTIVRQFPVAVADSRIGHAEIADPVDFERLVRGGGEFALGASQATLFITVGMFGPVFDRNDLDALHIGQILTRPLPGSSHYPFGSVILDQPADMVAMLDDHWCNR